MKQPKKLTREQKECLYALISRICKCIEHCASAKGYTKLEEAKILAKDQSKGE